jgi:hypothetical protein
MIDAAVAAAKSAADAAISESQKTARAMGLPGVPESQVEERLQAVKDWAADKLKQKDAEEKLKMKAYELDTQAQLERQKDDLEAKAAKLVTTNEKKAATEDAERTEKDAAAKSTSMLAKVKMEAEKASVAAQLAAAAKEKREAKSAVETADAKIADAKEGKEKATEESASKAAEFHRQKDNMVQRDKMIKEKDTKSMHAQLASAIALNVADVRKEMAEKSKTTSAKFVEKDQKVVGKAGADAATSSKELSDLQKKVETYTDKNKELTADLVTANTRIATLQANELSTKGEMKVALEKATADDSAKIKTNEVDAKQTARTEVDKANKARERASEQLRKVARVQTDAEKASLESAEKANSKGRVCVSELKQMQTQAITEEQAVAEQASLLKDDADAAKILADKKKEWNDKIAAKEAACSTSELVYTTKAAPQQSAGVQAPAGPSEEVTLLQLPTGVASRDRNLVPDDPWPLNKPIREANPDGTPGPSIPFANDEQRLAESNAAKVRGFTAIEGGAQAQTAYFKFPGKVLTPSETLKSVTLEFEKKGGPEADCIVSLTGCNYNADELTYDTKPIAMNQVSSGGTFPAADGIVKMDLDINLVETELGKNPSEPMVCIEISGGLSDDPDLITDVTLSMKIQREASAPKAPMKRIDVSVPRRRRSALDESRRRRSVQAIKDKAAEMEIEIEKELRPEIEDEARIKMPLKIEARKVKIENEMRAELPGMIEKKVKEELAKEFSADQLKAEADERRHKQVETAIEASFPAKYAEEKVRLESKMKNKLTQDMTETETKLIEAEATQMAEATVNSDSQSLLQGAIDKKYAKDYPIEMQKELEKKGPKDISTALDVVVVKSVQEKTEEAVDKTVQDEIEKEMTARETGAATQAATEAVNAKLSELVQAAIAAQVQTEKTQGTATGIKLSSNNAADRAAGLQIVTNAVAARPSPLSETEKKEIERVASNSAVTKLRASVTTEVNARVRTQAYIDNIIRDLKKSETERLRPIVKADILKDLEEELAPELKKRVRAEAEAYVNDEKHTVIKILRNALIQKNKVDLLPKMNAKLSVDVPKEINSAKFQAQMEAAALEMKAELKTTMKKNLNDPLERVAVAQIKEEEKEKSEALELGVKTTEDKAFKVRVNVATATDKVEPIIEEENRRHIKNKLKRQVQAKVKDEVVRELSVQLKNAIWAKWKTGTDAESMAYVKQHYEKDIRARVKVQALKRADADASTKTVDAKEALKKKLMDDLTTQNFNTAKTAYADQLKADTAGMSVADAKAVEFNKDHELMAKAKADAEKQAEIEVAGKSGEQIALRLKQEQEQKVLEDIDTEVQVQVQRKADALTQKALDRIYQDDLQAMEMGHAHVSEMTAAGQDNDNNKPNIETADRAGEEAENPVVKQVSAGAAAGGGGPQADAPEAGSATTPPASPSGSAAASV